MDRCPLGGQGGKLPLWEVRDAFKGWNLWVLLQVAIWRIVAFRFNLMCKSAGSRCGARRFCVGSGPGTMSEACGAICQSVQVVEVGTRLDVPGVEVVRWSGRLETKSDSVHSRVASHTFV